MPTNKYQILVAEDDPTSRNLLYRLLIKAGYEVTCVENGVKALEAFEDRFFNLVLTDWMMPKLDGIGLCRTIRKRIVTDRYVFIILLTAKNTREDILSGLEAGADDYLVKPFNPGELIARLNTGIRILDLETARTEAEQKIRAYSESLEKMVQDRTEQLRDSEERYRTIIENIEDGYYEFNLKGYMTFFNESALKFGGYSREELLTMHFREYASDECVQKLIDVYTEIFQTGRAVERVEWLMKTKSGEIRHMDSSVSLIRNRQGAPCGFRGIVRDVTDQKQLELELIEKRNMAEAASRAKSEFLANMSHEIRTPLNGIIGMTELIMETGLNERQRELLSIVELETNSLATLINQILDFSKIEANKMEIELIPFDLHNTMDDLTRIMTIRTGRKGLTFESKVAPDIPSRLVGDPGKLRQILMNLLTNALKFTNTGRIELTVTLEQAMPHHVKLHFAITDTGIGIASEKKAQIFDPFTQADGSTTRRYGGTGLGTTISKHLARLMGGEMGLESDLGKGSTFWFTVMLGINHQETAPRDLGKVDLTNLRIVLVNASKSAMADLAPHLSSWGIRFTALTSGKDALSEMFQAMADQDPYALIIAGGLTSDLDGFEFSQTIRRHPKLENIPILLMVATGKPGDAQLCRQYGIDGYLAGDVEPDTLRGVLMMLLTRYHPEVRNRLDLVTRFSLAEVQRIKAHILLVEDYLTNQQLAMRHLQNAGYAVDLAENGELAVKSYRRNHYDLILMDMQMPVMDGYAAMQAIRTLESKSNKQSSKEYGRNHIPIIATTAHAMKGDREKCLQAGADDYITKPLKKTKLLDIVEKWVARIGQPKMWPKEESVRNSLPEEEIFESKAPPTLKAVMQALPQELPIDLMRAIAEFEGDEEFFVGVLKAFLINVNLQIETLRQALSQTDAETVRKEAHSIKGGAAELAAMTFSELASDLEKIGQANELTKGSEALKKLESEYKRLTDFVANTYPENGNP